MFEAAELEQIQEMFETAESFVPFAQQVVDLVFKYTPALKELTDALQDYIIESQIRMFQRYTQVFTRDEAMALVLATKIDWKQALEKVQTTLKRG